MKQEISPLLLIPADELFINYGSVHFNAASTTDVLSYARSEWDKISGGLPFTYFFMDNAFAKYYQQEQRMAYLFNVFTIFTFLIAGMGLFGLAVFSVERRKKELSIRKTHGASIFNIVIQISGDFLKLVGIGFVIAIPIAFYLGNQWLQQFVYRIDFAPSYVIASGLIAITVAFVTVGWYSLRAARMNPAENLRSE